MLNRMNKVCRIVRQIGVALEEITLKNNLTIYEISTLAGVSISTVSRVLNGNSNVNEETRKRVEDTIRKYGFVPKQSARKFRRHELSAVGLMMNDIRNPYMCSLAYTINRELNKHWVNTVLCNIVDVEAEFINQLDHLIDKKINGVILMGSIFQHHICHVALERKYTGFPFVSINGYFGLPNVCEIIQDQENGTKNAVEYLYKLGKRHIAYIYCHQSVSDQKKLSGFFLGTKALGLSSELTEEVSKKSLENGWDATEKLLKAYPLTDAIMYSADVLAVGGVHYLNEKHIIIPEQVAVIGFNNSTSSDECYPPLTSIDNSVETCGTLAVDMILRMIRKETVAGIHIPCGLAIRETTERQR